MQMKPVESSRFVEHGYDPETKTARLRFKNGKAFDYPGVEPHEYEAFEKAESKGKHFHQAWRARKFTPVEEPKSDNGETQ